MSTSLVPGSARVPMPGIAAAAFQHPMDREATGNLRKLKGFDTLVQKYIEWGSERIEYVVNVASYVRTGPRQFPTLYNMLREACAMLDVREPELYVANGPINAFTFGHTRPFIVLYSGLIDSLTNDEILGVIAHELGHIKCGHVLYQEMARVLTFAAGAIGDMTFGLGDLIMMPIQIAFITWNRRSEYSADRAALLAVQDVAPCVSMLAKLAGGTSRFANELDPAVFLEQAKEFSEDMDKSNTSKIYRMLASLNKGTHPFTVERARALNEWVDSRQFEDMLDGNYERIMTGPGSKCVKCSYEVPSGAKFCVQCGTVVDSTPGGKRFCSKCGKVVGVDHKFCLSCGTALS